MVLGVSVCLYPKQVCSLLWYRLTGLILRQRTVSLSRQRCFEWTQSELAEVFLENTNFTKKWQAEGILRTLPQLTLIFCISICFKPRGNNGAEKNPALTLMEYQNSFDCFGFIFLFFILFIFYVFFKKKVYLLCNLAKIIWVSSKKYLYLFVD